MALIQNINTSTPNDNLGDTLRNGFVKTNENFTELNAKKVEKVAGKGLSTNDFTTTLKDKLDGIEFEAQKNVIPNYAQQDPDAPDYIAGKPSNGKILVYGNYSLVGQDLTINSGWVWQINNQNYTNTVPIVINFPYSSSGNQRLDLIVFDDLNSAQRVEGVESVNNPITPQTPENTVLFSITLITDGSLDTNVPNVDKVLLSIDYVVSVDGSQTFEIPDNTACKQVYNNGTQHWKSTSNNTTLINTWTQSGNIVTLNEPTEVNNYIVIFYQ